MGRGGQAVAGEAQAARTAFAGEPIAQNDEPRQRQAIRPQLDSLPASGRRPELPTFGSVAQAAGYLRILLLELSIAHALP